MAYLRYSNTLVIRYILYCVEFSYYQYHWEKYATIMNEFFHNVSCCKIFIYFVYVKCTKLKSCELQLPYSKFVDTIARISWLGFKAIIMIISPILDYFKTVDILFRATHRSLVVYANLYFLYQFFFFHTYMYYAVQVRLLICKLWN